MAKTGSPPGCGNVGWGTWLPLPRPDACFGPRSQISRNYAQIPALKCAADWNTSKLSIPSQNAQIPALKKNVTKRLNVWMTCGTHKGSKGHSFITRGAGSRIQALDCVCAEQRLLAAFIKIQFLCQLASLYCTCLAFFPLSKNSPHWIWMFSVNADLRNKWETGKGAIQTPSWQL